jgi:hypothetical protein
MERKALALLSSYRGKDFLRSTATSDVSAALSAVMLQAATATNINRVAKANALTLAAR